MASDMFILNADNELVPVRQGPYESEERLQEFLARCPDLLSGGQINPESPRRWLLVRREGGIPNAEAASDRWAVDHVFLDQDAVPTLVEVKRSSDTRIRREVVGQMLDYAANSIVYWPAGRLRGWLHDTLGDEEESTALRALVGDDVDVEQFWFKVDENLRTGHVRMVFVADEIPAELQRIVEFLNEQLRPAEVLAVEVKHYQGAGLRALVPRIIGRTAAAARLKPAGDPRTSAERMEAASDAFKSSVRLIEQWADQRGVTTGPTRTGWRVFIPPGDSFVWSYPDGGYFEFDVKRLRDRGATSEADQIVSACETIGGRQAAPQYPKLYAEAVVASWNDVRQQILDPLVDAVLSTQPGQH